VRPGRRPVLAQDRLEVERLIPRLHLEADSSGGVAVEHEPSVAKHADAQIHWRLIQHHDLHRPAEQTLEFALEGERLRLEGRFRRDGEQHSNIDIAVRARVAPSDRAEEIDGCGPVGIGLKESRETVFEIAVHTTGL